MNRGKKKGPFFSGLSITDDIEAPCLLISDPTLDLSQKISLSWYAGSEKNPHLRSFIVDLLNGISQLHQLRIVLFGGSGAGFAILSLINSLVAGSLAFVWNPQTSISRYFPNFVHRYLEVAFPNSLTQLRSVENRDKTMSSKAYEIALEKTGIVHNLLKEDCNSCHNTIFFLQNRHDWHLDQHANPYLNRVGGWTRLASAVFVNEAKTAAMVIGDWGPGHAVPSRELIHSLLALCVSTAPEILLQKSVNQFIDIFRNEKHYDWALCHDHILSVDINAHFDSASEVLQVKASIRNPVVNEKYVYAYYLYENGERREVRWYQPQSAAVFKLDNVINKKSLRIVSFVKDSVGHVTRSSRPVF